MHIVFLDFDDIKNPLLGAGQARATFEVGSRLSRLGHKVTVISSKFPGYTDRKEQGIFYHHIGFATNNIRLNNIIYIFNLPFAVLRLQADIIIECFTAPISTLFSPLFTKIPVVALPTSFEADRFSRLYRLPFWRIEKFGLRFYKYGMPYTKAFAKKMRAANKNIKTQIIPEGVSKEYFAIKRKPAKHILFLGRFDLGQKGIDLLLQAYAKASDTISFPLVMAGFGPDEQKIRTLVEKLNLQNKVKFVGGAFGKQKFDLLASSLFVAFSSRHEWFSLFSLEALATGLPLVAFDIPGLSWAPNDIVLKAKPYDIAAYAKLLTKASDKQYAERLGIKAKVFAKQYTWENVAKKFENFLKMIIITEHKI